MAFYGDLSWYMECCVRLVRFSREGDATWRRFVPEKRRPTEVRPIYINRSEDGKLQSQSEEVNNKSLISAFHLLCATHSFFVFVGIGFLWLGIYVRVVLSSEFFLGGVKRRWAVNKTFGSIFLKSPHFSSTAAPPGKTWAHFRPKFAGGFYFLVFGLHLEETLDYAFLFIGQFCQSIYVRVLNSSDEPDTLFL